MARYKNKKKKYKLLKDDVIWRNGKKLYRIQAIKNFGDIKEGDLGGYIEKETNLSQSGNCWVKDSACVFDDAKILDNALIYESAEVFGEARISRFAHVGGHARVCDKATVFGYAIVFGDALIDHNAMVYDYARVFEDAEVIDNAIVCDDAQVYGRVVIMNWAKIGGNANVYNCDCICNTAEIYTEDDYVALKGYGSENRNTTFFKLRGGDIGVKCGCFSGKLKDFKYKVKRTYPIGDKYRKEYLALIKSVKIHFGI